MFITMIQYKLKPGVEYNEAIQHFNEVAVPVYKEFSGCLDVKLFRYNDWTKSLNYDEPGWDYIFVEIWESDEALQQAKRDGLNERQNEADLWAFGEKLERYWASTANLAASS